MTTTIRKGSKGNDVATLQRKLNLIADGIFGSITDEAVRDFQKAHSLTVDGIVGPKTWAALGISSNAQRINSSTRTIDKIILHCSATPEGKDYTVEQIRRWHIARNFSDIGYHYVIYRDGSVHTGRPESQVGAHTTGYNAHSIGICYIGGCAADGKTPKDTRTEAQCSALVQLVAEMRRKYPAATVHGHNELTCKRGQNQARLGYAECSRQCTKCELANKACPSFDVQKEPKLCGR